MLWIWLLQVIADGGWAPVWCDCGGDTPDRAGQALRSRPRRQGGLGAAAGRGTVQDPLDLLFFCHLSGAEAFMFGTRERVLGLVTLGLHRRRGLMDTLLP